MDANYQRLIHELYSGINTRANQISSPIVKPMDFSPYAYGIQDGITPGLTIDPTMLDLLNKAAVLRKVAEAEKAREKKDANKEEYNKDLKELNRLTDKFDDMWRNKLGGESSLNHGELSRVKLDELKTSKEAAVSVHNNNISDLESEKGSLEDQIATASEEDKPALQDRLKEVKNQLETEKANKTETEKKEKEKIEKHKKEMQQLKDKLWKLREEFREYKDQLENGGSYDVTHTSKEEIKWRLCEISYQEIILEDRLRELTMA